MNDPYPIYSIGETESVVKYVLFGVAALAALLYCLHVSRNLGQKWPLYGFLGSALLVSYEPFNNLLAQCALSHLGGHARPDADLVRPDRAVVDLADLHVLFLVRRAPTGPAPGPRHDDPVEFLGFYGVTAAICAAFEPLFCHPDIGINWWCTTTARARPSTSPACRCSGSSPTRWSSSRWARSSTCSKKHVFRTDRETIAFIPLSPLILFGVHGSASIPAFVAVSEGANEFWSTVATLSTIAISFFYLWILSRGGVCSPHRVGAQVTRSRSTIGPDADRRQQFNGRTARPLGPQRSDLGAGQEFDLAGAGRRRGAWRRARSRPA